MTVIMAVPFQMMQNPDMIRNLMNSPIFQSVMNQPETLREMLRSHPQLREVMDRNPEVSKLGRE